MRLLPLFELVILVLFMLVELYCTETSSSPLFVNCCLLLTYFVNLWINIVYSGLIELKLQIAMSLVLYLQIFLFWQQNDSVLDDFWAK